MKAKPRAAAKAPASRQQPLIGWKLFRRRKDGSYGPLFINQRQKLYPGVEYVAECHPTPGYALRPGWHICSKKSAPHLSKKGRIWVKVAFWGYREHLRPKCQGGLWYTADHMVILEENKPRTSRAAAMTPARCARSVPSR